MSQSLRLSKIQTGEIVRMLGFVQCDRYGLRLAEMGLTPGTSIEVLQATRGQPMLLRVRGAQLAIGRRAADKIKVERVTHARSAPGKHRRGWRRFGSRGHPRRVSGKRGWKHWRSPYADLSGTEDELRER
jgi:Fe2+ transport system protein FeoA